MPLRYRNSCISMYEKNTHEPTGHFISPLNTAALKKKKKKKHFCEVKTFSRCMYTPASYGKIGKEAPKRDTKYQAARPKKCIYG